MNYIDENATEDYIVSVIYIIEGISYIKDVTGDDLQVFYIN